MSADDLQAAGPTEAAADPAPDTTSGGAGDPGPGAQTQDVGAAPAASLRDPMPEIANMLTATVHLIGGQACARYGVTPLRADEAQMVGNAGALVIAQYGLDVNPRALAWLTLIGAITGVIYPRAMEYRAARAAAPPPPPPPADAPEPGAPVNGTGKSDGVDVEKAEAEAAAIRERLAGEGAPATEAEPEPKPARRPARKRSRKPS